MTSNRSPSACHRVFRFSIFDNLRIMITTVSAKKAVTISIKAVYRCVYTKDGIMSAAFTILSLVNDDRTHDLNLTSTEISLEICHVIHGIPQAKFNIRKYRKILDSVGLIG